MVQTKLHTTLYRCLLALTLTISGCFSCSTAVAQEYHYEIGGLLGASMYMGDANKNNPFQSWHPAVGAVFRKNLNFRWALKTNLLLGSVSGDTKNSANVYPQQASYSFSRKFVDLGGQIEFNFFPYSDKFAYLQTRKLTPYLFTGLGLTYAGGEQTFFDINLPLGVGIKYKLKNRVNLGAEYSFRKLFSDKFDSPTRGGFTLDNPYQIKNSWLKNNDWYSLILLTLTWDFGPNDRKCEQ